MNIERLENQLSRRRNTEAEKLLDEVEYSEELEEEQALEYANNLRAFADYMGVSNEKREEYISEISERVEAEDLSSAVDLYGSIREAASRTEKTVDKSRDRYDLLMLEEIAGLKNSYPQKLRFPEYTETEEGIHLVSGESDEEWIAFEGEIEKPEH